MDIDVPKLKDGNDFQYTRHIVGDELGLKSLINACEVAIEKGEYVGTDLDDYHGVTKLDSDYLAENQEPKSTPLVLCILSLVLIFSVFLVVVGFIDFIKWF